MAAAVTVGMNNRFRAVDGFRSVRFIGSIPSP